MDLRLRAAVDTSLAWYADVFALHGVPTHIEDGVWSALGPPPPWHSGVKTLEPGIELERVLAVHEQGGLADSFGDLDLAPHGFTVLVDATWVHHDPVDDPPSHLPVGWSRVRDTELLAEWSRAHDYAGVLLPGVLDRPAFTVLAHHVGGVLAGGAIVHEGRVPGVVGLSNAWSTSGEIDPVELLAMVGALHPGCSVTDFAEGAELRDLLSAGYTPVGPQRVWVGESSS